ncbi:MAG TPA: hypothetical protein ENF73_05195, partial [Proteobacteria bacterium]|nr:hypothetical protein [Pseudomonadota bacterium]
MSSRSASPMRTRTLSSAQDRIRSYSRSGSRRHSLHSKGVIMLELLRKYSQMPGDYKTVNPFDLLYTAITVGLTYTLGTGTRALDALGAGVNKRWKPGEKLQMLFLAYSGARNTGAESRVGECVRQVNQVLGEDVVDINMTTLNVDVAKEYFGDYRVNLRQINYVFFGDVFKLVLENHIVSLVEGSCWKENFSTALTLYFLYGAGLAAVLGKPCFSYAVDAGEMNRINNFVSWLLSRDVKLITRSEDSNRVLESIHLPGAVNRVDTAWSMPSESPEWAKKELVKLGWDGKKPLLGFAFQNYFWWPVVPNLAKFVRSMLTGKAEYQYKSVYFYDYGDEDKKAFEAFKRSCAEVVDWAVDEYGVQPLIVAMEALDEDMCKQLMEQMKHDAIFVSCNRYIGTQIAAMLRQLKLLITTRYHAMVLSMPGCVPFVGLSRDERIRGVMKEIGLYDDYYVDYRTENL